MHSTELGNLGVNRRELLRLGIAMGSYGFMSDADLAEAKPADDTEPFIVKPYLQLGNAPRLSATESMEVLWHAAADLARWTIEVQRSDQELWDDAIPVAWTEVSLETLPAHRIYNAKLTGLVPGARFNYRLKRDDQAVFQAYGQSRKATDVPQRFAVFGDCGTNSAGQKAVAYQVGLLNPDYVVHPGDAVYEFARISEYRTNYYPIYNSDVADPGVGSPLLRSTPFFTGLGAHDEQATLDNYDDVLSYYMYWSFPLNGPKLLTDEPLTFSLGGTEARRRATLAATGDRFPRMAHYSFDYGDVHWTFLDTWGSHIDWQSSVLRSWLEADLEQSRDATWRFVSCYFPPFNSSTAWPQGQKMRVLTDLFEQHGVDLVFSGYAHSYQRTYPLRFRPAPASIGPLADPESVVPGEFQFDRTFDGRSHSTPNGVLYLITGGGGNPGLHSPEQTDNPQTWQPFTVRYVANVNHFTLVDVDGRTLLIRQIDEAGRELDAFSVTK